jgi:hypothetical protein
LHIGPDDTERFFDAIRQAVIDATIVRVTDREPHDGVVCGTEIALTVGKRTTKSITSWHYEHARDAPRLVTAYPIR